ncbi:hypothetical protein A3F28_00315 [Candidatus Uhrbacteria bacterium RIFCSPHIGHO2_12_FULL_57_11]|uniref:General secretion pathway GspH domain-containing protein n=1 Tax=Candidatus Uhrbacteria bacterium RIFCSPHIGHO2_12_FULL_57_11 TaxID=1802398 RepID=A0A1F7UJ49_9BACT|nr:MAG: hypothetical protein A3F28_00315 [Candidatus Uhrbacteria bacterium RIFCSPHIGHO2_12_FULL_57_11]
MSRPLGLSVVEITLTISIVSILAILGLPFATTFETERRFDVSVQELLYTLRRAQGRAFAGEAGSSFGVHLVTGTGTSFTMFRGATFAGRDQVFDEVYDLPGTVTLTKVIVGGDDVVFSPPRGKTPNGGEIILTGSAGESRQVIVNAEGKVEVE